MAKVSNERAEGHYWTVFGSSAKWDVMYWRDGYFWDSADCGYTEDKFTVGPQILPPGDTQSLRNAQSEAVAWGKPKHPDAVEPFFIPDEDRVHDWQKAVFTIPLYTHPAPQSEAVAVKAMEWRGSVARTPFGDYAVLRDFDAKGNTTPWVVEFADEPLCQTVEFSSAKAAAQADYEKRIRSALTHPAPPLAVTDERITEAVDLIGEASGYTGDPDALRLINKALEALTADLEAKQ